METRPTSSLPFLVVAAALACFSCKDTVQGTGLDAATDTDADSDTDSDSDLDAGDDSGTATGPGASLTGVWAQLVNVTIIQEVGIPLVSADQWVASRNWYLVNVTTDGAGNLTARERLCALELKVRACGEEIGDNTSGVAQSFIDHIPVLERHVTVDSDAPQTPWVSDIVYEVRGANLCNGECDPAVDGTCSPLPPNGSAQLNDSTPCGGACTDSHCDQDEDGHPGMTNILQGLLPCETYVAQRWWSRFDGEVIDGNTIAGAITDSFSEQTVLAGTGLCDSGDPGTRAENCPEHQYFRMIRLQPGATCADVLALTDCDEDPAGCDSDEVQPLDPDNDMEYDCPDDCD